MKSSLTGILALCGMVLFGCPGEIIEPDVTDGYSPAVDAGGGVDAETGPDVPLFDVQPLDAARADIAVAVEAAVGDAAAPDVVPWDSSVRKDVDLFLFDSSSSHDHGVDAALAVDAWVADAAAVDTTAVDVAVVDVAVVDDATVADDAATVSDDAAVADATAIDSAGTEDSSLPDVHITDAVREDSSVAIDDPFHPGSCVGPAMTAQVADLLLGSEWRVGLAQAPLMSRWRSCNDAGCQEWSSPQPHSQTLCTYSGGVTTRYKTFSFGTTLTLWQQSGNHRWTIQHTSEANRCSSCNPPLGMTFPFADNPMRDTYPTIRLYDPFPQGQYDYQEFDVNIGRDAELVATDHCVRFVSMNHNGTQQFAVLYRF